MNKFFATLIISPLLVFYSCSDNTINRVEQPEQIHIFKVEGYISHKGFPIPLMKITLDTLSTFSDSSGYFIFDSLKSGQSRIVITHPKFLTLDTLFTINQDITFYFDLKYKSDSFLPLKIGNKWYYNPNLDNTKFDLIIEVENIEEIGGLSYYKLLFTQTDNSIIRTYNWWMRIANDSLYCFKCDEAGLLAPFNIDLDSIFYTRFCSTNYMARLYDKSKEDLKYYYSAVYVLDADFALNFQKGIGITYYVVDGWYLFILDHYDIY